MSKKIQLTTALEPTLQAVNSVLSIDQVVRWTGFSRSHIYSHISKGNLCARKSGSRTIVLITDLQIFLDNLPTLPVRAVA